MTDSFTDNPVNLVVVPRTPGPLVRLASSQNDRDDIDEVIDEIFGHGDEAGPGIGDAVLVTAGMAMLAVSQFATVASAIPILGALSLALGCILPTCWLMQRIRSRVRNRQIEKLIGDGLVLRSDHDSTQALISVYGQVITSIERVGSVDQRFLSVAHAHMVEVAAALGAGLPVTGPQADYVSERIKSLASIVTTLEGHATTGSERQQALLEARLEVDAIDGESSLTEAAALLREFPGHEHG